MSEENNLEKPNDNNDDNFNEEEKKDKIEEPKEETNSKIYNLEEIKTMSLKQKKDLKINLQKDISNLKRTNNEFRQKLKKLSNKLTETLEKIKIKNNSNKPFEQKTNKLEVLQKELQNSKKQFASYEKELIFYKNKLKVSNHIDKIQGLEQEIYKGEKEISKLILENRDINKQIFKFNKKLKAYKNEADQAIIMNFKIEENKILKKKLREYEEKDKKFDENISFQKELIEKLSTRYKEVCTKVGEEPIEIFTKDGDNFKLNFIEKKNKDKEKTKINFKNTINYIEYGKPEDFEKRNFSEKDFNIVKNKVKLLNKAILTIEKTHKINEAKYNNLNKRKLQENKELEEKIEVLDIDINKFKENINKLREGMKSSVISPLEKYFWETTEFNFKEGEQKEETDIMAENLENITFILKNNNELVGILIKNNKKTIEIGKTKIEESGLFKKEINFNIKYEISSFENQSNFSINGMKFKENISNDDKSSIIKKKGSIKLSDINSITIQSNEDNILKMIIK